MRHRLLGAGLFLLLGAPACGTVTWVNDVSTTEEGTRVVVVGAQFRQQALGPPIAEKPIRWVCARAPTTGALTCVRDVSKLPQMR